MGKKPNRQGGNHRSNQSKQISHQKNNRKGQNSNEYKKNSHTHHERSQSRGYGNKNQFKKNNKNNKSYNNSKNTQVGNPMKNKKTKELIDPMNPLKSLKQLGGNSVFKIVPEGMNQNQSDDKFAALGGSQENSQQNYQEDIEQNQQINDLEQGQEELMDQQELEEGDFQDDEQLQSQNYEDEDQIEEAGQYQQEINELDERDGDVQYQKEEQIQQQEQGEQGQGIKLQDQDQDQKNLDISVINLKIQETLAVLMNISKLGQGKPRKYYLQKLKKYIHQYYGYNFQLIDHFLSFMNPTQMVQLFQANETQRPLTIRTNTLKTRRKDLAQALIQRGVNLDPLADWSQDGIKIYQTKVPIGATPEYLAGYYMLQSASSFLPVLALDPQMHEKVLDMAAAPGGKTSYIAQKMKNTGSVFANDLKKQRLRALQFNLHRLGITNTVVTCRDGRKISKIFPNTFDKVLLDSPCTGLGIISKDMSIKANRVLVDIYKNSHIQKELILSAIDSTKVGGVIVYSTCSVSPLENQEIVNFALKKRFVKIADVDDLVEIGEPGLTKFVDKKYHTDLKKTKRIYPHVHNMDGFYFAKLIKLQNGKRIEKEITDHIKTQ